MFETQSLSSHMCPTIRKTFKEIQKPVLPKWTLKQKTARKMLPCSQGPRLAGECLKFQGISSPWIYEDTCSCNQQAGDQNPDLPAHLTQGTRRGLSLFLHLLVYPSLLLLSSISAHQSTSLMGHHIFCRISLCLPPPIQCLGFDAQGMASYWYS